MIEISCVDNPGYRALTVWQKVEDGRLDLIEIPQSLELHQENLMCLIGRPVGKKVKIRNILGNNRAEKSSFSE